MKRSELKEAIKNEITSVLLEGMSDEERENRIQHLMRTGAKEKPLRKLAAIGKKEDEKDLKEGKRGVVGDPDEIKYHLDQYDAGNIDGDDLAQAIEEILVAMMNKSVTFSDIREEDEPEDDMHDDPGDIRIDHDYYTENLKEEDEPTAADLKKKDSVATISNKLQKVTAEIKKHLAMYKDAEGDEAKKLAINMLKKLNAEKKKLEKDL